MASRYGDDEIGHVLNKLGRRTGKGKRWNQERVHTARRNHDIAGHTRATPDPEILSLGRAAKEFQVSDTTIKRLLTAGLLKIEQVAPWAPWEIRRADLESAPIRCILEHLRRTGELVLLGTRRLRSRRSFNNHAHLRKVGIMRVSIQIMCYLHAHTSRLTLIRLCGT